MNIWTEVSLGVIAVATLAMAVVQVGVMVMAGMAARRMGRLVDRLEAQVQPLIDNINAIGREAARAASLATVQVERADKLFGDVSVRIEQAINTLQTSIAAPAREGRALLSAFRAAIQVLREMGRNGRRRQPRGGSEDEDALFI